MDGMSFDEAHENAISDRIFNLMAKCWGRKSNATSQTSCRPRRS